MKKIPYSNLTVFILFFGVALFESLQKGRWLYALIFLVLGFMSLWADLGRFQK